MADSASARLWAGRQKTRYGFFENMMRTPIRNSHWKMYSVEGKIESGATHLEFSASLEMNGEFYDYILS